MTDEQALPSGHLPGRRAALTLAGLSILTALLPYRSPARAASASPDMPPFVRRGLPGPFQEALQPLAGSWNVDKRIYIAVGTRDHPAVSQSMTCKRNWFGGGKHLQDVTEGRLGNGDYFRMGVLGFSNMDRRYEWATFDALNANSMFYRSAVMDTPSKNIVLTGMFTDQGLLGEAQVGKSIPMRTTLEILGPDRHVIDLTFMPPGEPEILIDHSIYTRA